MQIVTVVTDGEIKPQIETHKSASMSVHESGALMILMHGTLMTTHIYAPGKWLRAWVKTEPDS